MVNSIFLISCGFCLVFICSVQAKGVGIKGEIFVETLVNGEYVSSYLYFPREYESSRIESVTMAVNSHDIKVSQLSRIEDDSCGYYSIVTTWFKKGSEEDLHFSFRYRSVSSKSDINTPPSFTMAFRDVIKYSGDNPRYKMNCKGIKEGGA
ncbi:hypothetical protein [Pseudoalteromonas sp. OOF1S-7]|uniref:hypothetical protein n=1 Tax=Pseudoalteromonas sp. OOF1S-7 TaxID=2917757 RepID=UPI001EF4BFF4|nr:hypothetical protein [Pseudoalteromonas sp. OOF1S-7]MCG7537934.1 hypothetical protein [Pseudoalteromonas sp. OOF1S-7]